MHESRTRRTGWNALRTIGIALPAVAFVTLTLGGFANADPAAKDPAAEAAKVELGRRLFFDPNVSRSGTVSCGSCHLPDHGFSHPDKTNRDDDGTMTKRHSMTLIDTKGDGFHWDGEFKHLVDLVTARVGNANEVVRIGEGRDDPLRTANRGGYAQAAMLAHREVARALNEDGTYRSAFEAAFGTSTAFTERIAIAMSAYVESLRHTRAPIDAYLDGDQSALSAPAQRGMKLFQGAAGCSECHTIKGKSPDFTDGAFHNTGIAWKAGPVGDPDISVKSADEGRFAFTSKSNDMRSFKTPSLRDVAKRPPYMHDGSFPTLEEVVRYYASVRKTNQDGLLDAKLKSFEPTDRDVDDLVAFLESLSGSERPGVADTPWTARAENAGVRLVDRTGAPLRNVTVRVTGAGDVAWKGASPARAFSCTTDERGWIDLPAIDHTHWRIEMPVDRPDVDGPSATVKETLQLAQPTPVFGHPSHRPTPRPDRVQDVWIPDTCAARTVRLPVDGFARFDVDLPRETVAPDVLALESTVDVGKPFPATRLHSVETKQGKRVTYGVWLRGLYQEALPFTFQLPGGAAGLERWIQLDRDETNVARTSANRK